MAFADSDSTDMVSSISRAREGIRRRGRGKKERRKKRGRKEEEKGREGSGDRRSKDNNLC